MKTMNVICLVIWIINLVFAIRCIACGEPVSPVVCVCALAICILHYLEKIFE